MIGRLLEWFVCSFLALVFPSRFRVIPRMPDGRPLLRQFKIFETSEVSRGVPGKWHVGIYLQSFVCGEIWEEFHVHRWHRMISFVLSGEFIEERYPGGFFVKHAAPSAYTMDDTVIHRFQNVAPRTWTLFVMLGRNRFQPTSGWGYFRRSEKDSYRPWDDKIPESKRIAPMTMVRGGKA